MVHALLVRADGDVFLVKRHRTGFMDGFYSLPGGHLQFGESPLQALKRECEEEIGVVIDVGIGGTELVASLAFHDAADSGVNLVFAVRRMQGEPFNAEPQHFADAAFHHSESLPQPLIPWVADVLENRLNRDVQGLLYGEYGWD